MKENNEVKIKCPHCGEVISELIATEKMFATWVMRGPGDYDFVRYEDGFGEFLEWSCPECGEVLATDECDADRLFRTEEGTE